MAFSGIQADADDLEAAKAILRGLKARHGKTGGVPSLIHTSGTGVLIDDARGMYASDTIYSDLDIATLASIPRTQPHREVDLAVIDADNEGYVKTYIILPSTIYGRATGPLVDAGLQNPRSQQIPQLVDAALARGRAGVLGKGANIWSNVHIADLASLYILLVDYMLPDDGLPEVHRETEGPSPPRNTRSRSGTPTRALSRPRTPVVADTSYFKHGSEGYYFAEGGEHNWLSVSDAIGRAMVDLGKATEPTPTAFTDDEKHRFFNNNAKFLDSNSRCRADRARRLGWKPKKTTKDLLASVKQEVKGGHI
ncbi:hypothetical protein CC1G_06411 [Coprinopsis cinerea okayama7|uniref:NAD-dependent epimerase/dehydratase domain-containing protein n=1 Tax=Coprinopsis cinerea (strain Okayama-7 / 130 / ATCC MYA-4618 / FGSC 9003) TaxID=240176 RepID=A8NTX5_COPC7|nr:hypothetical protein CC1G_06411 [Coprinopsis cinerea okayama7\|eukprot:XP_001836326.2 hypothetical protein CC1G_06411 [Coprinopsis cinerea okayama7\